MKLSTAFEGLTRENHYLKILALSSSLITFTLLGVLYYLSDRPPIVVERTSHGLEIMRQTTFARSAPDQREAVGLMIKARFDTETINPELFLNSRQLLLRQTEQTDMKARGMSQVVVVREVKFEQDQILVNLDRVIAIGEVRSALRAKVRVTFEEVSPNELNPYGLLLSLADPIQQKESSR